MYQREFNKRLHHTLPSSVLFYGENAYLIEYYLDFYTSKLDAKETQLKLYHEAWDFEQAKSFLSQNSLFGGVNLLILISNKKIPKKELELLIELGAKNKNNFFLFYYMGEAKNAKSMHNSFSEKKEAIWVRCFEATMRDGIPLLQQKANKLSLKIDTYALQHLMILLNHNLALCASELEKLAILNQKITPKDIDRLVYSTSTLATQELLIALTQKKDITPLIHKLLQSGEDALSLLRATQYFFNQIFLFHIYIKSHGYVDSLAILGYKLPKPIEEQNASIASHIQTDTFLKIFEYLIKRELHIKSTPNTQKEALIYSTLLTLQSYL